MNHRLTAKLLLNFAAFSSCILGLTDSLSIANAESAVTKDRLLLAQKNCKDQEIRDSGRSTGSTWYVCDYSLSFESDGNLVLKKRGYSSQILWTSGTNGRGYKLSVQSDGNVVIYDRANVPIWATNTSGNSGAFLALQNDGNLVVYNRNRQPIFATNTSQTQAGNTNNSIPQFPGQSSGQFPGQVPTQFPGQSSGQFPGQVPTQFPGQSSGQFPGQVPTQFPGQSSGQFSK